MLPCLLLLLFFFFNDTATPEIYTLSLHDALPISLKWPSAREAWGYAEEDQAAANLWGHGLGLAQYDQPVISRIWSLDHPLEIRPGMVFALETQHGKRYE